MIPELSYSPSPQKYVETKSYATYEELVYQQRNSWWAKCLVGLFLAAGAAMLFYEFTQIEAGHGRGATLPKWVLAIYKVIGKWPTCSLLAIPGFIGIVWGGKQFIETYLLSANQERVD